jgi:predicted small secreted protein
MPWRTGTLPSFPRSTAATIQRNQKTEAIMASITKGTWRAFAALLLAAGFLAACNTVEGAGRDVSSAGNAIEGTAKDVKQ